MIINGPSLKIGSLRSDRALVASASLRLDDVAEPVPGGDGFLLEDGSGVLLLETDDIILQE